jgi:hypothetical protein
LKGCRGGNLRKVDTEVEADNTIVDVITPIFSGLETVSIESLKSVTPPSLEEVRKELSVKSDSQSVKKEECELMNCGSTAGGPHLNVGDLRRSCRLRR